MQMAIEAVDRAIEDEVGRAPDVAVLPERRRRAAQDLVPANHGTAAWTRHGVLGPDPLGAGGAGVVDRNGLGESGVEGVERV